MFKKIGKCWLNVGLDHLSPTQINKSLDGWFYEYVYRDQEWRRSRKPNAKMIAGNAAQYGWDRFFLKNIPQEQAIEDALNYFLKHKGTFIDDQKEMEQFQANFDAIPLVINNYIQAVKDIKIQNIETVNAEKYVELWIDGVQVPFTGRTDLETEKFFIEAKTKWQRRASKKDGSTTFHNIKAPASPDEYHARQVNFYKEATGKPGYLVYATPSDYKIFYTGETEQLGEEAQKETIATYERRAIKRQNLLELAMESSVTMTAKRYIEPNYKDINYYGYSDIDMKGVKQFYA